MTDLLQGFDKISLNDVKKNVRMMNRFDTKYVMTERQLLRLLEESRNNYFIQEIDNEVIMPYYTLYFDTQGYDMYRNHLHGKLTRRKVRIRRYVGSGLEFLEVKRKNNKGRTEKRRIPVTERLNEVDRSCFILDNAGYESNELFPVIENNFRRITLVSKKLNERITIDTALRFHNHKSGLDCNLAGLVIIELKRGGKTESPIADILKRMRVFPTGFSKYCMGLALTSPDLPVNRFKPRLRMIKRLLKN